MPLISEYRTLQPPAVNQEWPPPVNEDPSTGTPLR